MPSWNNSRESLRRGILSLPLKWIGQRLPGLAVISLVFFTLFGPIYSPWMFSCVFVMLHILFVFNGYRNALGLANAAYKVRLWSTTDWLQKYCDEAKVVDGHDTSHDMPFGSIIHVIILPNYKETMDTLCESLDVLASHRLALNQYKVCLAMEESEAGSSNKAALLLEAYANAFLEITFTVHPCNLPGEIRGKSSNVGWATAQMALRGGSRHDHEIVTVMDADTCFAEDYFSSVTYYYCVASVQERRMMMFAAPFIFDRNANDVPAPVRMMDVMWSVYSFCKTSGQMSNLYDGCPVKIPCSAYSLSMDLAVAVQFWDAGPEGLAEDLHMYLKCFFATRGQLIMKPIFSPGSQCNIEGEGTGLSGYYSGLKARYIQGIRHLWGSLDVGYAFHRSVHSLLSHDDGKFVLLKNYTNAKPEEDMFDISPWLLMNVVHRVFEATMFLSVFISCLILSLLTIPTGADGSFFWRLVTDQEPHPILGVMLTMSSILQVLFAVVTLTVGYNFEHFHQWVAVDRWALQDKSGGFGRRLDSAISLSFAEQDDFDAQVQEKAGLNHLYSAFGDKKVQYLGRRPSLVSARPYPRHILDFFFLTPSGIAYVLIPGYVAQICQLFVDRLDYKVSSKPTLNRPSSVHFDSLSSYSGEPTTPSRLSECETLNEFSLDGLGNKARASILVL